LKMLDILLAPSPIFVVLVGMIGMKKSAMKVAPVAMVYTIVLGLLYFSGTGAGIFVSFKKGVLEQYNNYLAYFCCFCYVDDDDRYRSNG